MKFFNPIFLFLGCTFLYAQSEKNIDHQSMLWSRYYNQLTLSSQWSVHSEFDNRIFINPVEQNLFAVRIQGRYKISSNVESGAGLAYLSVSSQVPNVDLNFNIPEYRGQQDISWKQTFGKIALSQRFQVEERFIQKADKVELLPGTSFYWRFRCKWQGEYNFWKNGNQFFKTILYDEVAINGGKNTVKNTFDQNRIYAACQYGISKTFAFELGFLKSFQQRASGVDYFDRDVIRMTIFHKIDIRKKQ